MLEANVIAESIITCPACGTSKTETMPTDACQYFYECSGCGRLLRPKTGDCCVFCSFGSVPCPPVQISAGARTGRELSYARPADAVVWYDLAYSDAAATSCCPSIGFFCCDEHLRQWLDAQTLSRAGCRLALDEALEVGRALFEPVLALSVG
jgi:hypothetical protein